MDDLIEDDVRRAVAGDSEAFIRLIKELELPLYRMAILIVKREEDCADAVQEAVLKAFKSLRSLKNPGYFKTWIYRILINECNRILKNRMLLVRNEKLSDQPSHFMDYENVDLRELVDHLDENLQIVIVLHYFHDLTIAEVADILGLSKSAVKTRLHRARKELQSCLGTYSDRRLGYGTT